MSDVLNFTCAKIQLDLDAYQKTSLIPEHILDGEYTVHDMKLCAKHLSYKHNQILNNFIPAYKKFLLDNLDSIKQNLREEYTNTINGMATRDKRFVIPEILSKYRPDINPITAVCYELKRTVEYDYDYDNLYHQWLLDTVIDDGFNHQMIKALEEDIASADKIIRKYNYPLIELSDTIPLELFHAKQKMNLFKEHIVQLGKYNHEIPR